MGVTSYDILMFEDLSIIDGDLEIGISDNQNVYAILRAHKGQFYQYPSIGLGIDDFQNSPQTNRLLKKFIKEELSKDNYKAKNIEIVGEIDDFTVNVLPEKIK